MAVRELRTVHGYDRAARYRDQPRRARGTYTGKTLRDGRGSDRALRNGGRSRGDEGAGAPRDGCGSDWLRYIEVADARRLQRQAGTQPHVGLRRDKDACVGEGRGGTRNHAGDDRTRAVLARVRGYRARDSPADHLYRAAGGYERSRRPSRAARGVAEIVRRGPEHNSPGDLSSA